MEADRNTMYKLPWSTFDNQAGWIEVTDRCNITCPGCYRQRLEGDRPLEKIKTEILECKKLVNCDSVIIAGGEPLVYPCLFEVVQFIASLGLKPLLLTNGVLMTREIALELKKAGLKRVHFHVDARQGRGISPSLHLCRRLSPRVKTQWTPAVFGEVVCQLEQTSSDPAMPGQLTRQLAWIARRSAPL